MMSEPRTMENTASAHRTGAELSASDLFHAEWDSARAIHLARYWSGAESPLSRHAEARLLWSDEALLVRFVCRQEEPLVISDAPQIQEKTIGLWERDVCEIFIAPESGQPESYFEFEAAPTGEWIDLAILWKDEGERETDWDYRSGMTACGLIEEGRVRVSMRVPWEAFGRKPVACETWRVNLFRCVGSGATRGYLAWQPTLTAKPNFHIPQAFGWLRFEE